METRPLSIRWDGIVGEAIVPMPHVDAGLRNLSRQPTLAAPAKLALSPGGAAVILAEAPAQADRARGAAAIRAAAAAAVRWLGRDGASADPGNGELVAPDAPPVREGEEESWICWIEEALGGTPWKWERAQGCGYRVDAPPGLTVRIAPVAQDCLDGPSGRIGPDGRDDQDGQGEQGGQDGQDGVIRVRLDARPLRVAAPAAASALRLFALEANARFRFARLSVGRPANNAPPDVLAVAWDTVVPPGPAAVRWLAWAVEALWVADAETRRALRALTDGAVAEAYLAARDPRRPGRTAIGGGPDA